MDCIAIDPAVNKLVERQRHSRVDSRPFCSGGAADCGGDFSRPRTLINGLPVIKRADGRLKSPLQKIIRDHSLSQSKRNSLREDSSTRSLKSDHTLSPNGGKGIKGPG